MKKIIVLFVFSLSLFAEFKTIDADTLIKMQKQGVAVFDIRTPQEWKDRGVIKGAIKNMFFDSKGQADIANFMYKLGTVIKDKNQPFIIYCAHANRTKAVGNFLSKQLGFKKVYELKGGIEYGWIATKHKTIKK